eukprot:s1701_g16.t1
MAVPSRCSAVRTRPMPCFFFVLNLGRRRVSERRLAAALLKVSGLSSDVQVKLFSCICWFQRDDMRISQRPSISPLACRTCLPRSAATMAGKGGPYKVFVGGLPQECTTEVLSDYFSTFGMLTDVVVMSDRGTGRSRGFGFVSFDVPEPVEQIMAMHKEHQIMGKWIDCKNATPEGTKGAGGGPGMGKGGAGAGGGMKGFKGRSPKPESSYGATSYGGYAAIAPPSSCGVCTPMRLFRWNCCGWWIWWWQLWRRRRSIHWRLRQRWRLCWRLARQRMPRCLWSLWQGWQVRKGLLALLRGPESWACGTR